MSTLIQAIDALLPQTQCGKCGHPGCLPYAEGIASGEAINKCPPGGQPTVQALAELLRVPELPLEQPAVPAQVAFIREAECIGCTKCIQACPVDAIVGAARLMHTVIRDQCTGCELCLPPCPVDCIDLRVLDDAEARAQRERADAFRQRHQARQQRLAREAEARRNARRPAPMVTAPVAPTSDAHETYKRLKVEAAMARVALNKAEKQYAQHGGEVLRAQVEALRAAAERAQQALQAAEPPAPVELPEGLANLKQAKVRLALEEAREALHAAEEASGKPAPDLQRIDKRPIAPEERALKTELAYARADLQRLERRLATNPQAVSAEALAAARQRLADAERRFDERRQP